jgi:hypothetical protein
MRLQNVKDKMMFQTEGKTAKGLIQENHDLKQAYESQQTTIGKLQQELQWYCQIQHSPSDQASSSFTDKEIVRKLSESDKLLSIQRTLARELGMQLDQRSREIEVLQERLDFEQYGRRREIAQMNAFLNDFVLSCLQIPEIAKDTKAKQAFDQLLSKSETLSEFGVELAVAVQLTSENSSRIDFLRSTSSEDEEIITDISLNEALEKISNLRQKEQHLRREAKHQLIEQMRKQKHATMKVKDLEERLKKRDADKRLTEEHLRNEVHQLRSQLDTLEQTLGYRSSYATMAAQSVRSLVELIEGQKMELEHQRDCLSTELASLRQSQDELKTRNKQLEADIHRLNVTALEEATATVRSTLDGLGSQCDSLRNENKTLQEQLDVLQETLKHDRNSHISAVENVHRLEQQIEVQITEIKELKAVNASLVATKHQLKGKMDVLERSNSQLQREANINSRRSAEPRQSTVQHISSGISYLARGLQEPVLIPRSSPKSLSSCSESNGHEHLGPTVLRTEDAVTQSLPPEISLYRQSHHRNSHRLNDPNHTKENFTAVSYQTVSSRAGNTGSGFASDWLSRKEGINPGTSLQRPPTRDTMQCLRCGSSFPITNIDDYEKHIKTCYSDVA